MTQFAELDQYIEYLRAHGRRPMTLHNYSINLNRILRTLKGGGRHYLVNEIDVDDVAWLYMNLDDVGETCRHVYIRLLSNFVLHFTGRDVGKQADILFNDPEVEEVVYISKEEFACLYHRADEVDRLILILGAYMGLRRSEMSRIREEDIVDGRLMVRGKGHGPNGKVSWMNIPTRVMEEVESFRTFKAMWPYGHTGEFLLESGQRHHPMVHLTPNNISRRLNRLSERTGVKVTPHALRRLYATTLYYDVGADIVTIKNLMRHAKAETTIIRYIAPMKRRENEAAGQVQDVLCAALGEF